ncbi:zf-HC2 domain-containing protein [Amycolatopsis pithecellobii]|uniref:Zf-HC2 domain-containing protein n=1 Tax=Amycolatopsis pithecellobii TaxID=664692 RepID=A0A6N7Z292_9PSEU|nr:zf-HC2 domain-containing protein [Amycolatopsis pithecellobii]MTD53970.1 zf-HC2 domain-containing protein [Amycolatopsis pithecellobii]
MGGVAHTDIAAYVLGVLDEAERTRFEAHLLDCPHCQFDLLEFYELPEILAEVGKYWPDPPIPQPRPLGGMFDELARIRRRRKILTRVACAVAVLLIIAGPLITLAVLPSGSAPVAEAPAPVVASTPSSSPPDPGTASMFAGSEAGKSLQAQVIVQPTAWGSNVDLVLSGLSGPRSCRLVAVPWAGPEQTVSNWSVPAPGGAVLDPLRISGGTALSPAEIARFEVRTMDGELLETIPR